MTDTRILIFEPVALGHEMHYVRYFLASIQLNVNNPHVTLLTTAAAAAHVNCQKLVSDFPDLVTVSIAPPVTEGNRLFRRISPFQEYLWKNAETFARGFAEIGPDNVDIILLPNLECIGLLHLCLRPGLFGRRPWITVIHNVRFHHRAAGIEGRIRFADILQYALFRWLLRDPKLIRVGTNDPYLPRVMHHPKIASCPHPASVPALSSVEEARAAYGIRPETVVILVYGVIDRRKCIDVLLEGMARVVPDMDVTVLLAGVQNTGDVASALNGPAAQKLREHRCLVEVNRFIIEGQDIDPMSVADIVWVFYRWEFRTISDVLTRAAISRRPVIARRLGVIGRLVDDHRLGLTVPSEAPDAIAEAVIRLAGDPALRQSMGENGPDAFPDNTPENLARPIVESINHTMAAG